MAIKHYFSPRYFLHISSFFLFFLLRILFSGLVSVFLLAQGYVASVVSTVSAVALVVSFLAVPLIGKLADVCGVKRISTMLLILSSIAGTVFAFSKSLLLSGVLYCLIILCLNTLHPIVERQATQTSFSYGSIRIWGTLGNAVGTQLGGIMYQYVSPQSVYILFSLVSILTCIVFSKISKNCAPHSKASSTDVVRPSRLPAVFFLYLAVVFLFYAALDSKTLYLAPFLNVSGFSVSRTSSILFLASLFEIPVVLLGGRFIDKHPCKPLVLGCSALLVCQLCVYAVSTSHILIILATLLTNSVVSMLFIMINMKVISELIDADHQVSALTITSGIRSLAAVIGQTISGYLIDRYSYRHCFILLSCLAIFALLMTVGVKLPKCNGSSDLYA